MMNYSIMLAAVVAPIRTYTIFLTLFALLVPGNRSVCILKTCCHSVIGSFINTGCYRGKSLILAESM